MARHRSRRGAALSEYVVLVSSVAVLLLVGGTALGKVLGGHFQRSTRALAGQEFSGVAAGWETVLPEPGVPSGTPPEPTPTAPAPPPGGEEKRTPGCQAPRIHGPKVKVEGAFHRTEKDGRTETEVHTPGLGVQIVEVELPYYTEFDLPGYHAELEVAGTGSIGAGIDSPLPVDGGVKVVENPDGSIDVEGEAGVDVADLAAILGGVATGGLALLLAAMNISAGAKFRLRLTPRPDPASAS